MLVCFIFLKQSALLVILQVPPSFGNNNSLINCPILLQRLELSLILKICASKV